MGFKDIVIGLSLPFLGTTLGAACVLFQKDGLKHRTHQLLIGFAAGVMMAASVWSLLIPAMESADGAVLPAVIGFWLGILFLLFLDNAVPHMHQVTGDIEGPKRALKRTTMMLMAVTIHNIPEGMAVGVVYAGVVQGSSGVTAAGALALALGIAIQNFPEGAIVSMPLKDEGMSPLQAFGCGILSGAVEPAGALVTIVATALMVPVMPYLLAFAAGAMVYVIIEELIPEMMAGPHSNTAVLAFSFGFSVMMVLDVVLG